jgi:hypothetical protein
LVRRRTIESVKRGSAKQQQKGRRLPLLRPETWLSAERKPRVFS